MYEFNGLDLHEHGMFIYNSKYDRFSILSDYIGNSVLNNNRVLAFIDSRTSTMLQYFIEYLELPSYDNSYQPVLAEEYIWTEKPNVTDFLNKIKKETDTTIQEGFEKLDIIIDIHYLTSTFLKGKEIFSFEKKFDKLYKSLPISGLCTYYFECLPYPWLKELQQFHDLTIISDSLIFPAIGPGEQHTYNQFRSGELDEAIKNILFKKFYTQDETKRNPFMDFRTSGETEANIKNVPPRFLMTTKAVIWMVDSELKISYVSPSIHKIIDVTPGSCIGIPLKDFVGEEAYNKIKKHCWEEYVDTPFHITHAITSNSNQKSTLETELTPLVAGNFVAGYVAVSRDITTRKQKEKSVSLDNYSKSNRLVNYLFLENSKRNHNNRHSEGTITEREFEIIHHLMEGLQNREIAEKLHVAEITVKKHLSSIYKKLNVRNRVELVKTFRGIF